MSVSLWSYRPEYCDNDFCVGDCDLCDKPSVMEEDDIMDDYIKRLAKVKSIEWHIDHDKMGFYDPIADLKRIHK